MTQTGCEGKGISTHGKCCSLNLSGSNIIPACWKVLRKEKARLLRISMLVSSEGDDCMRLPSSTKTVTEEQKDGRGGGRKHVVNTCNMGAMARFTRTGERAEPWPTPTSASKAGDRKEFQRNEVERPIK